MMDMEEFRKILSKSGVDVWTLIETAISVASLDYREEIKHRRDDIVQRLYTSTATPSSCPNCCNNNNKKNNKKVEDVDAAGIAGQLPPPIHKDDDDDDDDDDDVVAAAAIAAASSPESIHSVDNNHPQQPQPDPYAGLFDDDDDDEQSQLLKIKEQLEDTHQSEDSLVELLQGLADMDITFKALKETDIGRNVNRLRKHSSSDVRRLVKHLVRKWKDLVDEWVKLNTPRGGLTSSTIITDGDSPHQNLPRNLQNGHHHQIPDFGYSPNPHNGASSSDRNNLEPEHRATTIARTPQSASASAPPPNRPRKETSIDPERLASARKRLHENYQEAQNAKKQRTIQVMDIHEIPKPKNGFIAKNKGGSQGRHYR